MNKEFKMVNITKEFDNKLLKRKEVVAEIETQSTTTSRKEAKEQLAKKLKADEKLMIIENITSHFGSKLTTVTAFVYDDEETLKKVTLKHILKRNEEPQAEEVQEA